MTIATGSMPESGKTARAGSRPLRPVSLSAVTWDFALVGRTRMLTEAWLRLRQPTVFVQVPSYRTALERLLKPLRPADSATVVRPWPIRPARWWDAADEAGIRARIRKRAAGLRRTLEREIDFSRSAAVVVSPVWTPWLDELPFGRVIYDCIDDAAVHVPRPRLAALYQRWNTELIRRADGAVVTAEILGQELRAVRADLPIRVIRNGVDATGFERSAGATPRPADMPARGRPIIGFVGALYDWIDWGLIVHAARALSDCDFVFVGPTDGRGATSGPAALPNVRFLGPRPYDRVPAYMAAFDAAWVPFDASRVSRAANPVKIYEYLAVGKPVVTTPVADTDSFGGLVRVGRTPEEIVAQLRAAVGERDADVERRRAFARANSWDARAVEYVSFLTSLDQREAADVGGV